MVLDNVNGAFLPMIGGVATSPVINHMSGSTQKKLMLTQRAKGGKGRIHQDL